MRLTVNYGHGPLNSGGNDPGAVAPDGYQESTETCDVGSKVVTKLKANGWDVLAIQDGDLNDVTNQSNAFNADYFISVHANSFSDPTAHGVETYALQAGGQGEKIAREIQKELVAATGLTNRGVKFANLHVLRETNCPAALVEIGFISNPQEEALMKSDTWDNKVASAICKGFSRAVGVAFAETIVVPPVAPPVAPAVMYRVILDGKQIMAIADQGKAIAEVKKAVDAGQGTKGTVQRNTDGVNVFEYVKPAAPVMDKDDQAVELMQEAIKILEG